MAPTQQPEALFFLAYFPPGSQALDQACAAFPEERVTSCQRIVLVALKQLW